MARDSKIRPPVILAETTFRSRLMPVIHRMQRLHLLLADTGRMASIRPASSRYADGVVPTGESRMPELVCGLTLLAADIAAFLIAAIIAGLAGYDLGGNTTTALAQHPASGVSLAACVLAGMVGYFSMHEHYELRTPFWTECRDVVAATGGALVLAAASAFLIGLDLPRLPLLGTACLFPPAVIAMRRLARSALDTAGFWRVPVVVLGEGAWADQAAAGLGSRDELGYDVVAQIAPADLGTTSPSWRRPLRQHHGRLLVLAFDGERRLPPDMLAGLVRERVPYALLPKLDGLPSVGSRKTFLGQDGVLLSYRNNLRKPVARALKMALDFCAAAAALVVLAPVMLIVAALVSLDGGPVFYAHKRVGAYGRVFDCLKFRSMVVNGDSALKRVLATDANAAEEWTRTQKLRRDPRVTWIGRFLRKTSLDELPQLLNVLRAEMSLVGPRPIVSLEIPKYGEDIAYYYETRPGITGLWQVSGRSDTTYAERVRLDTWYVKNWTLWQDVSILARTIPAVISGRGAG